MNDISFFKSFHFNIFRFDKYHLTDHSKTPVPRHYFGCLIHGTAKIKAAKTEINLKPGEIIYIPKDLKYQSQWFGEDGKEVVFYSIGFEFSPVNKFFVLQKIKCSAKTRELFQDLCKEIPFTDKSIGKLYYFFSEVADTMKQAPKPLKHPQIESALNYMTEHSNAKIPQIADHLGVSESGIYLLFKKVLGKTPNEIRLEILCEKAISLLSTTNKSVQEISDMLEFSSTAYFRKVLKDHTGKTPLVIRKEAAF